MEIMKIMSKNPDRNNISDIENGNNINNENSKDKNNHALKHIENIPVHKRLESFSRYSYDKTNNRSVVNSLVSCITDRGKVRQNNEDSFHHDTENGLFIVADGMGGHSGGEEASKIAIQTVSNFLKRHINHLDSSHKSKVTYILPQNDTDTITNKKKIDYIMQTNLHRALLKANAAVRKKSLADPELEGMGTTVTIAQLDKDNNFIYTANVGDSRAYVINRNSIRVLTRDYTMAEELVRTGLMSRKDALKSPFKHQLTKYIGGFSEKSITKECVNVTQWSKGEYLLLCSDGLTDMVSDAEIQSIIVDIDNKINDGMTVEHCQDCLDLACNLLVELANNRGGKDNITAVLVRNSNSKGR
jgi:protein phosphatase